MTEPSGPKTPDISRVFLFDTIRTSIFRIRTEWAADGASATGFAVARLLRSNRLVLATAAHVLDIPNDRPVTWTVEQLDDNERVCRCLTITQTGSDSEDGLAYRWHKQFDVGVVVLPQAGSNDQPFAYKDESPVNLYPSPLMAGPGTWVAWAGFSGSVARFSGQCHLCYFEGTISATINQPEKHICVVDGHSGYGVSGGPLWTWSDERQRIEVLVSQYSAAKNGLPGFCIFEPIQHVTHYLEWCNRQWDKSEGKG